MKVTLLLADAAQSVGGKLYILGGGWSTITAGAPFAIAAKIEVPWHQATDEHTMRLELVDADGQPVCGTDEAPVVIEGTFCTGIPPGITAGTPLDANLAVSIPPGLPLEAGRRYEWRLTIDGQTDEDWHVAFSTRPIPPAALAA